VYGFTYGKHQAFVKLSLHLNFVFANKRPPQFLTILKKFLIMVVISLELFVLVVTELVSSPNLSAVKSNSEVTGSDN